MGLAWVKPCNIASYLVEGRFGAQTYFPTIRVPGDKGELGSDAVNVPSHVGNVNVTAGQQGTRCIHVVLGICFD